jgi:hypothetical protein
MPIHSKMPLRWSDSRLSRNPKQMTTDYRFQSMRSAVVCEFVDCKFQATGPYELAANLVSDGVEDGTVQMNSGSRGVIIERFESLHGMAARWRSIQLGTLDIPSGRLATLFTKTGRGCRPDVTQWWNDTLSSTSHAWRLRRYLFAPTWQKARKFVDEVVEFSSVTDMIAFKLRFPELWY